MPKVSLLTLQNLDNPTASTSLINQNFATLAAQIDLLLSRDGESPNTLLSNIDMNGYRIINLPVPTSSQEPARHGDIQQYVDEAEAAQEAAELAQAGAEMAQAGAELAETGAEAAQAGAELAQEGAETALETFQNTYFGVLDTEPSTTPIEGSYDTYEGDIYYDKSLNRWRIFVIDEIVAGADEVISGSNDVVIARWVSFSSTEDDAVVSYQVDRLIVLTEEAYLSLTPDPRTLYFLLDD